MLQAMRDICNQWLLIMQKEIMGYLDSSRGWPQCSSWPLCCTGLVVLVIIIVIVTDNKFLPFLHARDILLRYPSRSRKALKTVLCNSHRWLCNCPQKLTEPSSLHSQLVHAGMELRLKQAEEEAGTGRH